MPGFHSTCTFLRTIVDSSGTTADTVLTFRLGIILKEEKIIILSGILTENDSQDLRIIYFYFHFQHWSVQENTTWLTIKEKKVTTRVKDLNGVS